MVAQSHLEVYAHWYAKGVITNLACGYVHNLLWILIDAYRTETVCEFFTLFEAPGMGYPTFPVYFVAT